MSVDVDRMEGITELLAMVVVAAADGRFTVGEVAAIVACAVEVATGARPEEELIALAIKGGKLAVSVAELFHPNPERRIARLTKRIGRVAERCDNPARELMRAIGTLQAEPSLVNVVGHSQR